jgi:hypothetical protein
VIILKQVTPYDNFAGLEATWVDRAISPDTKEVNETVAQLFIQDAAL